MCCVRGRFHFSLTSVVILIVVWRSLIVVLVTVKLIVVTTVVEITPLVILANMFLGTDFSSQGKC